MGRDERSCRTPSAAAASPEQASTASATSMPHPLAAARFSLRRKGGLLDRARVSLAFVLARVTAGRPGERALGPHRRSAADAFSSLVSHMPRMCRSKFEMDHNFALSPADLDAGYILTCQSHPASPTTTIDYDDLGEEAGLGDAPAIRRRESHERSP